MWVAGRWSRRPTAAGQTLTLEQLQRQVDPLVISRPRQSRHAR